MSKRVLLSADNPEEERTVIGMSKSKGDVRAHGCAISSNPASRFYNQSIKFPLYCVSH
jgi:hypothetical protein